MSRIGHFQMSGVNRVKPSRVLCFGSSAPGRQRRAHPPKAFQKLGGRPRRGWECGDGVPATDHRVDSESLVATARPAAPRDCSRSCSVWPTGVRPRKRICNHRRTGRIPARKVRRRYRCRRACRCRADLVVVHRGVTLSRSNRGMTEQCLYRPQIVRAAIGPAGEPVLLSLAVTNDAVGSVDWHVTLNLVARSGAAPLIRLAWPTPRCGVRSAMSRRWCRR
jgi:hypothetical protein